MCGVGEKNLKSLFSATSRRWVGVLDDQVTEQARLQIEAWVKGGYLGCRSGRQMSSSAAVFLLRKNGERRLESRNNYGETFHRVD